MTARVLLACVALILMIALTVREASPVYQKCQAEQSISSESRRDGISNFFDRALSIRCTGKFVDENNAAITAIATVLLTIITCGLIWTGYQQIVTSRLQLRAYVFADNATLGEGSLFTPPRQDKINVPGVFLTWRNTGQTPALNVVSWAKIEVIEPINEEKLIIPKLTSVYPNNLGANGSSNKAIWYERALTPSEIQDVNAGARSIYLYGRIEYEDIFRKSHFTNFRVAYAGQFPPPPNAIFQFCISGNSAS